MARICQGATCGQKAVLLKQLAACTSAQRLRQGCSQASKAGGAPSAKPSKVWWKTRAAARGRAAAGSCATPSATPISTLCSAMPSSSTCSSLQATGDCDYEAVRRWLYLQRCSLQATVADLQVAHCQYAGLHGAASTKLQPAAAAIGKEQRVHHQQLGFTQ